MTVKEIVQSELTRIYKRDGDVRASTVVDEARPKDSPIHDQFEWDNRVAGEQYRLAQARRLIRVTPIRLDTGVEQRLVNVPVVRVDSPTAATTEFEGVYKPVSVVAASEPDYKAALGQLMSQLRAAENAVLELKRARGVKGVELLPTLTDALKLARATVRLMMKEAA